MKPLSRLASASVTRSQRLVKTTHPWFYATSMHAVHRCGLQLQISHLGWSVCLSLCVLGIRVSCAKMAEPIEMPFGELTHVDYKGEVLRGYVPAHSK